VEEGLAAGEVDLLDEELGELVAERQRLVQAQLVDPRFGRRGGAVAAAQVAAQGELPADDQREAVERRGRERALSLPAERCRLAQKPPFLRRNPCSAM
jgi:hypothetical protein